MSFYLPEYRLYMSACGFPFPSTTDSTSWTSLSKPAGPTSTVQVGLYGYDISCILSLCAESADYGGLCFMLTGSGIDGWSMGLLVDVIAADTTKFTIVQH